MKTAAAMLLSLSAFAALAAGVVWTAEATVGPRPRRAEIVAEPAPAEPGPAAIAPAPEPAIEPAEEAPTAIEDEPPGPAPAGIEVPDLTGRTALRALRTLRALGLDADIRDEDGQRVPAAERRYMNVVEQSIPEGGHAPDGWVVRLEARYPRAGFASGY